MSRAGDSKDAIAIKTQCWNAALSAYGTAYIFERRSRVLKRRLQWLTYTGLVVPLVIGLLVLGYGTSFVGLAVLVVIAIAICVGQSALALWSIIAKWIDDYSYATHAIPANYLFSERYVVLASNSPSDYTEFRRLYENLQLEDRLRQQQDYQQGIKDSEKRMGMRAALRKFRRRCAGCDEVPSSMSPTDCDVCGNFNYATP